MDLVSTPFTTLVHPFSSPTAHSCAYELGPSNAQNALVFIGGLGDGPHTVPYIRTVADRLQASDLSYSVFEFRLTSSFTAFGYSSLKQDVEDISSLVKYLRHIGRKKVVLLGHSTGCQDCMEYYKARKHVSVPIDALILQAPVSDREGFSMFMSDSDLKESLEIALDMIKAGKEDEIMPRNKTAVMGSPITAYRWHSLMSPGGDDDYFSSDLPKEALDKIWSTIEAPVLVLHSGEDEFVPKSVDVQEVRRKWMLHCSCRGRRCPGLGSRSDSSVPRYCLKQGAPVYHWTTGKCVCVCVWSASVSGRKFDGRVEVPDRRSFENQSPSAKERTAVVLLSGCVFNQPFPQSYAASVLCSLQLAAPSKCYYRSFVPDIRTIPGSTLFIMCFGAVCPTCSKRSWRGCGSHIPRALDGVPEKDWCTCEPKVTVGGKAYPPAARMQVPGAAWLSSWFRGGSSNRKDDL